MKNKFKKIILLLIIILLVFNNYIVYADGIAGESSSDPILNPGFWKPTIQNDTALSNKAGAILKILNTIGVISGVIVLCVIGIKYMLGSVEQKADYKKAMIPYIIGIFFIVLATSLPNIIYNIIYSMGFFT